jgi:PKD repeat protein
MKKLYFVLLVLLSVCTANSAFGQSISINYFDSAATYAPGSGVSVQLNITGAFDRLNNQFILQLSDSNGNFTVADTKNLTFVQDFYTPNISGVIPAGIPAGTGYRLRVVSTLPTFTSVVSNPFEIVATPNSGVPAISFPGQTFNINCLDKNFFGFLNNSTTAKTATIYSSITGYDYNNYNYAITLFTFYPSFQSQTLIDDIGAFNIPSDLPVGNYSIEIKRTHKTTGVTSINTYNFLFNTGNTSLGNTSSENICTTNTFNINVDLDNIRTNYPGSYYTFDFGDGTPVIYRTHAELMANPTLQHQYNIATCDASASLNNGGYYQVTTYLYNKGIGTVNNTNPNLCSVFSQNGNGKSAKVRVSTQPIANFNGPNSICKSSGATYINTTLGGKWSANGVSCNTSFNVIWLWKRPGSADFTLIPTSFYNNTNKDLVIPAGILTTAGIMYIKLQANNPDGCIDATEKTMAVCIENPAVPSFDFVYGLQTLPNNSTLCINTTPAPTVILKNKSNTLVPPSPCSSATYLWTITPSTGATISNPTAVDPTLTFSIAGTYNVRLRVTNSCGAVDTTKTITVVGPPSISNYSGSVSYCDTIPKQIDFAPTYNANFAKAADLTYTWTVTGTGITSADYEFAGGTTANSPNPKIIFKKYGTYAVKVVFTNGCGSAEATKTFIFNQPLQASITANTSATDITVCPSTPINLNALINGPPGYTYVWTKTGGSGSLSANNVLNPVYTPSLADNGQQITFTLTVTYPGAVPSPCTSPLVKTIKVTYVANNTAANTTLARCSGTAVNFTPVSTVTGSQFTWTIKSIGPNITGANASAIFGPGPINDVLVNTGTAIQTVVYEISAKSAGGCVGTSFTLTVSVYPPITGNVIKSNQTICTNQTPAALGQDPASSLNGGNLTTYLYGWEQKVGAGPWTTISGATSATYQPGALTNTTLYRRTVWSPDAQSCVNVSNEITVTVNPLPSVTLGTVTAVCNSETSFSLPYSAAQNTPTKYSISVGTPAMPGFVPVVDADLIASPLSISIPSGLAQNNYVFVFTVKNANGCVSASQTFTVPIKSPPTPAVAGSVDTLINCNNGSFTMSANLPTIGSGLWSIVGAANGAIITSPSSRTTTITGLLPGKSVRLRWTISNAPCADSFDDIILINEAPTTVASAGATLRNCDSGSFTLGANTPAVNELGTWTIVGAANGAVITNPNNPNSTVTGLQAGKSVTLKWTITNKACSSNATTTVSNVNPITGNTISFGNPDPCTGQQITIVGSTPLGGDVATLFPSNFNYSWEIKNSLGGWDPLPNITKDLSNYTTSTTFTVRRKVTSYECTSTSNELTITVLPLASNTIGASQVICYNSVPTELTGNLPSGGSGSYTFQWQSSIDNTTFTNIALATNQNFQPGALTTTTYFRRLVSSGTCLINSTSVQITVNPKPVMNTITDKTFCNNASVSPISFASTPGTNTTYSWTNSNTGIGLAASGTGATPLFTSSNLTKEPIFGNIVVTPTYTVATSTCAFCEGTTTSFKLFVLPTIGANAIPDTTVCTGSTIPAFTPGTDATTFSGSSIKFKWTVSGSGINLLTNSIAQNQVSAFTATNTGTSDLQATITVTPVYNFNGVACDGIPTSFKITVKPNPSIAAAGPDVKICGVTEYTLAATSPIVGTGVWVQTLGPVANFTNPSQYNTKVSGLQPGNRYEFQWTVSNLPCSSSTNDKVIVDVLSPITNTIKANKLTICDGESVIFSSDVLSGGDIPGSLNALYSYIWETSPNGTNNWQVLTGSVGASLTLSPTSNIYVRRKVLSHNLCEEISPSILITVNPGTPPAKAGLDQILCNLSSTTLTAENNLGSTFAGLGTWTDVTPGGSTPALTFSNANDPGAVVSGLQPGKNYILRWTIAGLAPCAPTSDEVSITVRPEIVANAGLSNIFCDQSATNKSYTLSANTPRSFETGLWTVVSGPAGSSFSAATSPTSSINNLSPGTYILKWEVKNDANACAAVSDTMKLEVFAAPISGALTSSISQVCDSGNSGTITLTGHVGTIKQWEYKEVGGAWTILANTTTTQSFINLLKTTYYRALVVSNGPSTVCPSSKYTDSVKIQVDPASVGGTTAGADTVCQGSNTGTISLSGQVGTAVEWQYSTNNGTSWTAIANTTATLTYTNLTTPANTITQYQYRARVKSGVCSEQFSSITTIRVLPPVTPATATNVAECNVTNSLLTGNTALQGIGTWMQLPGGPSVALISDIHNPTSSVSNLVVGVYTFKWTIDNGYCAPSSATMTLTNYPAIVNEIQTAVDTICADQAILISDKTHSGGTGTYTYKWQSSPNGTTWNDISPAQTGLTLAINLNTSTYFRRIISSGPCSSVSDSIYIFVQPALANNTITAITEVCINKPVAIIVGSSPTGGDGIFSYQWQSKVGAGAWTTITGATGKDYQPQPLLQTTSFRRIVTTALCNGPQQSVSVANEIIVRLNAKAEFSASKLVNCSPFNLGSVIALTPYPDLNSTYKWYADGVLIGTGTTFPAYTIANDGVTVAIKLVTLSKFGCDSAEKVISFQTIKHVTATFTKSVALGCGPLTVNFNNTSTPAGPGPQYQWNFGNGQTSTLANPPAITFQPHPLNRDTTYVIRLRAYTDCQESIFIDSVLVRPKPVSIFSPDKTEGCAPVVVNFTNQSKGHPATYKFIFGDGNTYTTTTLETVQHIYQDVLVNTLYTAKLIVTNECGVDSSSYVIKVKPNTVVANLVVNGPEKQGCPPHTVTFFNNSTGANQFIWNFGDGTPIITNAARTMVHTFLAGGTYQVKLTATNGCSVRETTETIVVYPEPISSFTTVKNTYCKDEWINFVNTSPQGDFVWTFGDGVSSTQTNPQHRFVTPGTYVVTLTTFVTQPDGTRCSKSVSQSYTVLNPPIATFSSNASAFNCAPFHLIVSNTSQFANKYSWYVDGVLVSTQATPLNLWLYASNKVVTVRLVAENTAGCASASVEQTVQMYPRPTANFVVLPSQIIKIPNYTFRFQNTTSGAVTSYKWTFGDGNSSTEANPTHTYKMIGQYQVNLIAFNQEGCSDTLSRQVEVQTVPGYLFVPNAFEPGSQTYELKTFKPKGSGIESYHLKIFNKWGYLVWETTTIDSNGSPVEGWDGMMNGVPAPPDVYVWTIEAKFINQTVWPGMRYKSSDKPKTVGSIHLIK